MGKATNIFTFLSPSIWRHEKTGLPATFFIIFFYWRCYQIFQPNLAVVEVRQHNTLYKNYIILKPVWILLGCKNASEVHCAEYQDTHCVSCIFFKSRAIYVIITWNTTVPERQFTHWVIKKKYKYVVKVLICSQIENLHNKSTVLPFT